MAKTDIRARGSAQESGQILVMTAVTMVALLGIAALSLDVSFMYDKRNRLHAAADAAAKSTAIEVVRNPTVGQSSLDAFADQQVAAHGFSPVRLGGTTTVTINHPPLAGAFVGNVNYVEAVISEDTSTFFARILGRSAMTPGATAVAGSGNPSNCLIVKQNFSLGNTEISTNGCGVAVGGNLAGTNPNAEINGTPSPSVAVTGTCSGTCGAMGTLTTGAPPPTDPLASLVAPAVPGVCIPGVQTILPPGCYTSIQSSVESLSGGLYYVTGSIDIGNNQTLSGTNVLIYMTGAGKLNVSGNHATLRLTAQTTGAYKGVAIFQDPSDTNNFGTGNNFNLEVTGAIYMPGSDVSIPQHLDFLPTTCSLFIAKSLTINNGNGQMTNSGCAGLFGGALFLTVSIAQ